MAKSDGTKTRIAVVGDVVLDHHVYEGERVSPTQLDRRGVRRVDKPGGAAMLAALIEELVVEKTAPSRAVVTNFPKTTRYHAFARWRPYVEGKDKVWRATLLGYGDPVAEGESESDFGQPETSEPDVPSEGAPDLLVIDDAGLQFRSGAYEAAWGFGKAATPQWILLKMSAPVARGDLWLKLEKDVADRIVCMVSLKDLRTEQAALRRGHSWERIVSDLQCALGDDPVISRLRDCKHLIITISREGALWIERGRSTATLVFDAGLAEDEFSAGREGELTGYMSIMTAAIALALANAIEQGTETLDIPGAMKDGIRAMRDLDVLGHGKVIEGADAAPAAPSAAKTDDAAGESKKQPDGFPFARIAKTIRSRGEEHILAVAELPWAAAARPDQWTIVETLQTAPGFTSAAALLGLARNLVVLGANAVLKDVPHAAFGKLITAERSEIEALREIRDLMTRYAAESDLQKPISIGIFGPPGAGKSFGVKQLAEKVFGKRAWLEFNLSQFEGPRDLMGPFHQARDLVLSGVTPVVFWDEFDSREYMWLQYLLAPMQDGRFQDGQLNHAVGKSVFVFAGGTSSSYEAFGPRPDDKQVRAFALAKGPDFLSRLDAYYDVMGPNPREKREPQAEEPVIDPSDQSYPLRRALLLRQHLFGPGEGSLDIDPDLLNALLLVPKYRHGSRSLEKLALGLKRMSPGPIRRSAIPSPSNLSMLVDAAAFNALLNRNAAFRMATTLEAQAKEIHATYLRNANGQDVDDRVSGAYDELASAEKEDNRAAARRTADVLALVGLSVVAKPVPEGVEVVSNDEVMALLNLHMERLAEAEHNGWMAHRRSNGWIRDDVRDYDKKTHPCLVAYSGLEEKDKKKDRAMVLDYPRRVRMAGFEIARFYGSAASSNGAGSDYK